MMASEIKCDCSFVVKDLKSEDLVDHYSTCAIYLHKRLKSGEFPNGCPRYPDGTLRFQNPHLKDLDGDFLYHLALGTKTHDLKKLFGDVKFVCMGGTAHRMEHLANLVIKELGVKPEGGSLVDMTAASHRYSLFKVGPVVCINHGIGISTLSVVLQEVIKLLQYCGARDPIVIRVGTSGGLGVQPGTVVISNKGYDGMLKDTHDVPVFGKIVSMPAILDQRLAQELKSLVTEEDGFETLIGNTMCSNDFYNGQGRIDGPFCDYTEADKQAFLRRLMEYGIKNIEMEVTCFAALTYKAGIKAADVCVTLVNRLNGDQILTPKSVMLEWQERPMVIILRYMKEYLKNNEK